ncbi:hypothetical protein [uncultured Fibrobacter sp.]|uniref:hypothetical protein n=1 Tax=uncultured Fibrobacter sp. TaxID=261512 RepID=UPI0025EFB1BE|nr:hypothetical protein [uncultured Fibrobacter sp.]
MITIQKSRIAALAALAIAFTGCGDSSKGEGTTITGANNGESLREYLGSEEIQSDLENLAEFTYYAEYLKAAPIAFMATDDGLYTKQVDSDEAEEYFEVIETVLDKLDDYKAAWAQIDSMKALMTETPHALEKAGIGLISSFTDFCSSLWSTGKEMREKSMARIGQLDDNERKTLFEGLSSNLRKGETDYKTWWKNFNRGDYDRSSAQIYNNFMHNGESSFMDEAETITQVVAKKGTELVEKGAEFEVQVMKTTLPSPVTRTMGKIQTAEKIDKIVTHGKDMTKEELKENMLSLVPGYKDADKVAKMAAGYVEDKSTTAENYQEKKSSLVNFTDLGSKTAEMAIAINKKSGKVTIGLGTTDDGKNQLILKEEGEHLVSFLSEWGDKLTQKISTLAGELYNIFGEINEKAIRDSIAAASSSSVTSSAGTSSAVNSSNANSSATDTEESSSSVTESSSSVPTSSYSGTVTGNIVGTWKLIKMYDVYEINDFAACRDEWYLESEDGDIIYDYTDEECVNQTVNDTVDNGDILQLKSDGTGIAINHDDGVTETVHYSYDAATGTITELFATPEEDNVGKVTFSGNTMSITVVEVLPYGTITSTVIFEKID